MSTLASSPQPDREPTPQQPTLPSRKKVLAITEKPEKIRVELNIEKWPAIWQPAKSRNKPTLRILERETKLADGSKVVSRVEISFNHLGTLSTEEQKMFYALIKHWEDSGRPDTQVFFSDRLLARILKKGWGTNVIDSTTKSLRKLRSISLEWTHSYYDKTKDGLMLRERRPFTMLSELRMVERAEHGAVNKALGYFKFDDHILRNLLANYTKPFLIDEFFKIKSDIGLLLYNHVDLILFNKSRYERCTKELFADLGLKNADYDHMHKRKRALEGALKELTGLRISSGVITLASIEKTQDKKDYKVVFQKSARAELVDADQGSEADPVGQGSGELVINDYSKQKNTFDLEAQELVQYFYKLFHGVDNNDPPQKAVDQAITLLASHGLEKTRYIIEYSQAAARETKFDIQHFGGILHYTSKALADHEQRLRQQQEAARRDLELAARAQQEMEQERQSQARLDALSPEEFQTLHDQVKEELLNDNLFFKAKHDTHFTERAVLARMRWALRDAEEREQNRRIMAELELAEPLSLSAEQDTP